MDLLTECASVFQKLTGYQYRFTLGRKGILKEITLGFSETDFHHLAGLHKLKDLDTARENRSIVFQKILAGQITCAALGKSDFFGQVQNRLSPLSKLEILLDQNQQVFRYNKKRYPYSSIEGEFLLKMGDGTVLDITFLFLDQTKRGIYYCRSFFPMEQRDYTKDQMKYALLKKKKICLATGSIQVLYDRISPKDT